MRINYIITAYNEPELLYRLINQLKYSDVYFYIHIDLNIDIKPFKDLLLPCSEVTFLEDEQRVRVYWGDITMIYAELNLMKYVLSQTNEGYIILLSGQDYPVKSNKYIQEYLTKKYPTNFLHAESAEIPSIKKLIMHHSTWHWVSVHNKFKIVILPYRFLWFSGIKTFNYQIFKKLLNVKLWITCFKLFFIPRNYPKSLKLYAAETWWELPTQTVKLILDYLNEHPEILKYYKTFGLPEESLIQSVVYAIKPKIEGNIQENLLYVNRYRKDENNIPIPYYIDLTIEDKDTISEIIVKNNDKLFARKFSINSKEILDYIDIRINSND